MTPLKLPSGEYLLEDKVPEDVWDICPRCGAEYDDLLGIGLCYKCLYGSVSTESGHSLIASHNYTPEQVVLLHKIN